MRWDRGDDVQPIRIRVNGSFTASHVCAEPEAHEHTWHVAATFEVAPRTDARLYRAALDKLLAGWHGKQLPPELDWSEDLARAVSLLVKSVALWKHLSAPSQVGKKLTLSTPSGLDHSPPLAPAALALQPARKVVDSHRAGALRHQIRSPHVDGVGAAPLTSSRSMAHDPDMRRVV